ncbi:uncharacterized protein LOC118734015 [Rhagoletis pomonella]|uniref:uncharacterized protein LOC118734015 n=1 Tax=Rhagoletis pomonella TaxID=28610 RepID=UPI00177D7C52|nr:uncharacterized protein LOC118734015 [Rhagoletis pomonella]
MRVVWFCFKLIEGCLGCLCMGTQIEGFLNVAVSQDLYLYITLFSVSTCISFFGCLNLCMENDPSFIREVIWNGFACFGYILASILTMYHAEKDLYLIYLSDLEIIEDETTHSLFNYSKFQAISAIVTGVVHLLHSVLAADILFTDIAVAKAEENGIEGKNRFTLYFGGLWIHTRLMKWKWFRRFESKMLTSDIE